MTDIDTAALRAAAEAATPGPWAHLEHEPQQVDSTDRPVSESWLEQDATHIAAANPAVVLALLDRLAAAEGAVARVWSLARRFDQRLEESGFDPLDIVSAETTGEAERLGFLDGVRTVTTNILIALDEEQP